MISKEFHSHLKSEDLNQLFSLWNAEYPQKACFTALDELKAYLDNLNRSRHQLLKDEQGALLAWFCLFERHQLPWFAMIVRRDQQGEGLGRQLLQGAQKTNSILNGWVVAHNRYQKRDGSPYRSPLPFYEKMGFRKTRQEHDSGNLSVVHIIWP